jgi:hypothetical protein
MLWRACAGGTNVGNVTPPKSGDAFVAIRSDTSASSITRAAITIRP